MAAMQHKKINRGLEKIARGIHESDEFVGHVANIAERYRREHTLETGPRGRDVRRSLRGLRKHAAALSAWLDQAQRRPSSLEREALNKIGTVMHGTSTQALTSAAGIMAWLKQADQAAAIADEQLAPKRADKNAPRIAAEALRATFEHHGLKWSTQATQQKVGAPIELLCALAKHAGDVSMTPQAARAVLIAIGARPAK